MNFTVVCPTEIAQFTDKIKEFRDIGCEVLAISTDSHFSHLEWTRKERKSGGLGKSEIPLVSDLSRSISSAYGCLVTEGPTPGIALRATYIIDPRGIIRHISITDLPVGRCPSETLRMVKAFQATDKTGDVCPASWTPGAPTVPAQPENPKTIEYFEKIHSKPGKI